VTQKPHSYQRDQSVLMSEQPIQSWSSESRAVGAVAFMYGSQDVFCRSFSSRTAASILADALDAVGELDEWNSEANSKRFKILAAEFRKQSAACDGSVLSVWMLGRRFNDIVSHASAISATATVWLDEAELDMVMSSTTRDGSVDVDEVSDAKRSFVENQLCATNPPVGCNCVLLKRDLRKTQIIEYRIALTPIHAHDVFERRVVPFPSVARRGSVFQPVVYRMHILG